ncbi:MAG TPA: hypothetical protein PLN02_06195, partial [Azonexus sp.]|nr:hypothetical protein [Azonexus sp.]
MLFSIERVGDRTKNSLRPVQPCNNPHIALQATENSSLIMNPASLADLQSFAAVARLEIGKA